MMFFLTLTIVFFIFFIGYIIIELSRFLRGFSLLERLAYSWGLGVGLIGLQLFFYTFLNISWNRISILFPWGILVLLYLRKTSKKDLVNRVENLKQRFRLVPRKVPLSSAILTLLIFLLLLFTGIESILRPVQVWDGWANWILRPKVFYTHNTIPLEYFPYTLDSYPLILPLMGTFYYIMIGGVNDRFILFLFFMFYLVLGGVFFATARRFFSTKKSLLLTFLLMSLQNVIRHGGRYEVGQADLALSFYIFSSTVLLWHFLKTKSQRLLLFLSIMLGITGQIKNDGLAFVLIALAIVFFNIIRWKKYTYILFMLLSLVLLMPWQLYKIFHRIPSHFLFRDGIHNNLSEVAIILFSMAKEFINIQNWNLLWVVLLFSVMLFWRKLGKAKLFLLVVSLQWLSYFAVFLITPTPPVIHITNIIDKLYIHLAPLALLIIGTLTNAHQSVLKKTYAWKWTQLLLSKIKSVSSSR